MTVMAVCLGGGSLSGCGFGVHAGGDVVRIGNDSNEAFVVEVRYAHTAPDEPGGAKSVRYHPLQPGARHVVGAVGYVVNTVLSFSILDSDCKLAFTPPAGEFGNPSGDYLVTSDGELEVLEEPLVLIANSYEVSPWSETCEGALLLDE